jgi:hypothetical protein
VKKRGRFLERRRFIRFSKSFGVNIIALNDRETLPKLDHEVGVNLSLSGALIKCEKQIPENSKILMKLMLVRDRAYETICVKARVTWCMKFPDPKTTYYIGMKFLGLKTVDIARLKWFFA